MRPHLPDVGEPEPLITVPDLSPEARRKAALRGTGAAAASGPQALLGGAAAPAGAHLRRGFPARAFEIVRRVWIGAYNDGFIHAGNFAYMALMTLFPAFIVGAAVFSAIGESSERAAMINAVLLALPRNIREVIGPVAHDVIAARSGALLWLGGLVGLWTMGSLVDTLRDILRRAYGLHETHGFWRYRLLSTAVTIGAVLLLQVSLFAQVGLSAAQEAVSAWFPTLTDLVARIALSSVIPAFGLLISIYLLFLALTPPAYRGRRYPKWPGAVLVTGWWMTVALTLPGVLRRFSTYDLTYGSLAGVMITLFFFWLVGLGVVVGAELNAALAETPEESEARAAGMRAPATGAPQDGARRHI